MSLGSLKDLSWPSLGTRFGCLGLLELPQLPLVSSGWASHEAFGSLSYLGALLGLSCLFYFASLEAALEPSWASFAQGGVWEGLKISQEAWTSGLLRNCLFCCEANLASTHPEAQGFDGPAG